MQVKWQIRENERRKSSNYFGVKYTNCPARSKIDGPVGMPSDSTRPQCLNSQVTWPKAGYTKLPSTLMSTQKLRKEWVLPNQVFIFLRKGLHQVTSGQNLKVLYIIIITYNNIIRQLANIKTTEIINKNKNCTFRVNKAGLSKSGNFAKGLNISLRLTL